MVRRLFILLLISIPFITSGQTQFLSSGKIEFERKINVHKQIDQDADNSDWYKDFILKQPKFLRHFPFKFTSCVLQKIYLFKHFFLAVDELRFEVSNHYIFLRRAYQPPVSERFRFPTRSVDGFCTAELQIKITCIKSWLLRNKIFVPVVVFVRINLFMDIYLTLKFNFTMPKKLLLR